MKEIKSIYLARSGKSNPIVANTVRKYLISLGYEVFQCAGGTYDVSCDTLLLDKSDIMIVIPPNIEFTSSSTYMYQEDKNTILLGKGLDSQIEIFRDTVSDDNCSKPVFILNNTHLVKYSEVHNKSWEEINHLECLFQEFQWVSNRYHYVRTYKNGLINFELGNWANNFIDVKCFSELLNINELLSKIVSENNVNLPESNGIDSPIISKNSSLITKEESDNILIYGSVNNLISI